MPSPRGTLRALSVAPMMDRTDRHYRAFLRTLTSETLLYTEMIVAQAIIHGDRDFLLGYDDVEHPLALQIGGDDPAMIAECSRIAEGYGYDEINLNIGCPSDRVQKGRFGACLMHEPEQVARCVDAARAATALPVTVKHRIGVDDLDRYEDMLNFVDVVTASGADRFSVHARKAWLKGLSPKENRTIPPLRYDDVYRLKRERPQLHIEINGGIKTMDETLEHLKYVDAVMIGRGAYDTPYRFADADQRVFGIERVKVSRRDAIEAFVPYVAKWSGPGQKLHRITRHLLNLFAGIPGNKAWKRALMEGSRNHEAGPEVLLAALDAAEYVRRHTEAS